jgi:N4-gp56 family major capsid protein
MIDTTLVANTIQPKYSGKLLKHAVQETRLVEFAQQEELPAGIGSTAVRFFRPPQADLTQTGAPGTLTEGTPISTFRDITYTPIDVALVQLGQASKVSDIATNVGLIKYLDSAITLFGEEFALDVDTRIRNKLCHASTGLTKRYAQGAADFATLSAATLANGRIIPRDLLDSMTRLKINRAPKIKGKYIAIMPPQHARDVMNDAEFREVVRNSSAEKIYNGEIGDYYDLKCIEGTNPFQEDETEGTYATTFSSAGTNTTGLIYSTVVTGMQSYGAVNMKKMGASLLKPQVIINADPDKSDPLNQFIVAGWKAFWASVVLNANWGIALRGKTQFA